MLHPNGLGLMTVMELVRDGDGEIAKALRRLEEPAVQETGNLRETVDLLVDVADGRLNSQHAIARHLGVSVGLVNALIKRAVRKGLIKVKEAPARRYAYYLTPQGFAEKSRLVAEYLDFSLSFFRGARSEYAAIFAACAHKQYRRVLLCGAGELAEIAALAAEDCDVDLVGVLDRDANRVRMLGLPVYRDLGEGVQMDAAVITDCRAPQDTYERVSALLAADRIFVPHVLRVTRTVEGSAA